MVRKASSDLRANSKRELMRLLGLIATHPEASARTTVKVERLIKDLNRETDTSKLLLKVHRVPE